MHVHTVYVKKTDIDEFRKWARRELPNEVEAYLTGIVTKPGEVRIDYFAYPSRLERQSPNTVSWYGEDVNTLKREAQSHGKKVLGSIHSHPYWDAVLSETDWNGVIEWGHPICGIFSVLKNRSFYRFWNPRSSLPCKVYTY